MEDLLTKTDEDAAKQISDAKYRIITIGRYSNEKDLKTLLKAMEYSKHSQEVRLIFAGRGPQKKKLMKIADKLVKTGVLKYPPIFGFYNLKELQTLSCSVDLYIHCAFIEVEGLSCMEAIQVGIVPIIAKGKYTATSQFALSEKSVFKERDAKDLASKIDYWLDHDEERQIEAQKYIGLGNKYNIDYSIKEIIKMFEDALKE
jgi:glycosyltransferase involved in cell wall biosynthesis